MRPTILLAPPRMWERIYSTICTELRKRPAVARKAFYGGSGAGAGGGPLPPRGQTRAAAHPRPLETGRPPDVPEGAPAIRRADRVAASGAAPLSKDLAEFYEAVGMPLIEGYGLTEGGVATLNPLDRPKPGSIGKPLPGVEVRFAEDGELLLRARACSPATATTRDHRRSAARRLAAYRRRGSTPMTKATSSSPAARRS